MAKVLIVEARFYDHLNDLLLEGARAAIEAAGHDHETVTVPGALEVPGAIAIERNVLEWRCDPTSSARIALAVDHDVEWIVMCSEGYTSSLAAAALQQLGIHRATDLVGGYKAVRAAGLLGVAAGTLHFRRDAETVAAH